MQTPLHKDFDGIFVFLNVCAVFVWSGFGSRGLQRQVL